MSGMASALILVVLSIVTGPAALAADEPPCRDVLFIGDSHSVGVFGHALDELLRKTPGDIVRTYASCGSSERSWYKGIPTRCGYLARYPDKTAPDGSGIRTETAKRHPTPLLPALLEKPAAPGAEACSRLVIVALGSNSVTAASAAREYIDRMLADIAAAGASCAWVGPPRMRLYGAKVGRYYEVLADAIASSTAEKRCQLVDSRKYTSYPPTGGDGVHYGFKGGAAVARAWAKAAFDELELK